MKHPPLALGALILTSCRVLYNLGAVKRPCENQGCKAVGVGRVSFTVPPRSAVQRRAIIALSVDDQDGTPIQQDQLTPVEVTNGKR